MTLQKPQHTETQDPNYRHLLRDTIGLWILWAGLSLVMWVLLGDVALLFSIIMLGTLLLYLGLRIYHRLHVEQFQHYWQTEALFSIYSSIPITQPLPALRFWAASPDFISLIVTLIKQYQPRFILELGSGVSTLIEGYGLREIGEGYIVSLEHSAHFANVTSENIQRHGLQDFAQVIHTPLKSVMLHQITHLWYDTSGLENLPPIDLLIVDGPSVENQVMARYPAVPLLFQKLNPGALILVDGFSQNEEYEMVKRWIRDFHLTIVDTYATEKGAIILRKGGTTSE
ncbi:MAG: class I SAM-dependent methyltransferase [Anaerolineae bacterium]|nr:class I SAM-dependent methyltransferase [Anaerolineae bacterium]